MHLGKLATVVIAHNRVGDSQPHDVASHRLEALGVDLVGEQEARVPHQRRYIRGLAPYAHTPTLTSSREAPDLDKAVQALTSNGTGQLRLCVSARGREKGGGEKKKREEKGRKEREGRDRKRPGGEQMRWPRNM